MRTDWRNAVCDEITDEEAATRLFNAAKGKAKKRRLEFNLKYNDVLRQVQRGHCAVTGIPFDMRAMPSYGPDLPFRASLDRIDNTIGYVPSNIQVVCKLYNHCKWNWNDGDVEKLAEALVARKAPKELKVDEQLELPLQIACQRCRRRLTSEQSIRKGYGPCCAKRQRDLALEFADFMADVEY